MNLTVSLKAVPYADPLELCASIVEANRAVFNAALEGQTLKGVLDYYHPEIPFALFPALMFSDYEDDSAMIASPQIAQEEYVINVQGFVVHENNHLRRKNVWALANTLRNVFNLQPPTIETAYGCFFNEGPLISRIRYLNLVRQEATVATFTTQVRLKAHISLDAM